MNGDMKISSKPGAGTNVIITLPNIRKLREVTLCVNIDVASNKEVNYGIFKSSDGRRVKKSLAA